MTDALRARVRAAAGRLGYVPNLAARALATRRSGVIGVMVYGLADAMIAAALTGCEKGLAAAGYRVLVIAADSPCATLAGAQDVLGRGAQALIFLQTVPSAEIVQLATANGIACITVGDDTPDMEGIGAALSLGRGEGAELAVHYLASLGHRCFGLIGAPRAMLEAVRRALKEDPTGTEVAVPGDGLDPGQAMRHLLERTEPPTAVLCASDVCALAALRECTMRGVAVPGRVSLIGFGDAEFARWAHPALSTIRVGTSEIGLRAAKTALARLQGLEFEPARPPIKLIARESTTRRPY